MSRLCLQDSRQHREKRVSAPHRFPRAARPQQWPNAKVLIERSERQPPPKRRFGRPAAHRLQQVERASAFVSKSSKGICAARSYDSWAAVCTMTAGRALSISRFAFRPEEHRVPIIVDPQHRVSTLIKMPANFGAGQAAGSGLQDTCFPHYSEYNMACRSHIPPKKMIH